MSRICSERVPVWLSRACLAAAGLLLALSCACASDPGPRETASGVPDISELPGLRPQPTAYVPEAALRATQPPLGPRAAQRQAASEATAGMRPGQVAGGPGAELKIEPSYGEPLKPPLALSAPRTKSGVFRGMESSTAGAPPTFS